MERYLGGDLVDGSTKVLAVGSCLPDLQRITDAVGDAVAKGIFAIAEPQQVIDQTRKRFAEARAPFVRYYNSCDIPEEESMKFFEAIAHFTERIIPSRQKLIRAYDAIADTILADLEYAPETADAQSTGTGNQCKPDKL
jgi:hypothetical protein